MDSNLTQPKVSVIMSTYNDGAYLKACIDSVLTQEYSNFEFIIIDDASTDDTQTIIQDVGDERIIYSKNAENKGLIKNLNSGINQATGKYIARIDSDDAWLLPSKLSAQVAFLESNPEYAMVGTRARVYDESGTYLFDTKNLVSDEDIRNCMLIKNPFVHSSVLIRKELVTANGNYKESEKYVEDYGLWMRLGNTAKIANLDILGVYYRLNGMGITQKNNLKQVQANTVLIKSYRDVYPNYIRGLVKWQTKEIMIRLGFLNIINRLKR